MQAAQLNAEYQGFLSQHPEFKFKPNPSAPESVSGLLADEMVRQLADFSPALARSRRPIVGWLITLLKFSIGRVWRRFASIYLKPQHDFNQLNLALAFHIVSIEESLRQLRQEKKS